MSMSIPIGRYISNYVEKRAERVLRTKKELWKDLEEYRRKTDSVGCSYSDFLELYKTVRQIRPEYVLELGTGTSTIVIAHALKENGRGAVVSMEEKEEFYNYARNLLPSHLKQYVEIHYSPAIEKTYGFFRGSAYKEIPQYEYQFVFVDGPAHLSDPNGDLTFNFDLLDVIRRSERPVEALIDDRQSTCFVYSHLLPGKVRYDHIRRIGIVSPVTKHDLLSPKQIVQMKSPSLWQKAKNYIRNFLDI